MLENELKMAFVQRSPGEFHFERAEALLAFAESQGLLMRGHTLLWHHPKWLPRWLDTYDFGPQPATAAADMLEHARAEDLRAFRQAHLFVGRGQRGRAPGHG